MKKFTSFLVLSFLAAAQDLSQLAGVKLTGKVDSPVVENRSGRTVIPLQCGSSKRTETARCITATIPRQAFLTGNRDRLQKTVMLQTETPIVRAIVFADGEFVGADKGNDFQGFRSHLESERGIKLWKK